MSKVPPFAQAPAELLEVAQYLRGSEGKLKIRQGILNGRRVDFFKGKHAINAMLRDSYKKSSKRPAVANREEAAAILKKVHALGFFLKVAKEPKSKALNLQQMQDFSEEAYFFWMYDGPQWKGMLIGIGVLLVVLAGVMFPLWPATMRLGVYYLSLGVLGLMGLFMLLAVVRLFIWIGLVIFTGRGGWLFPNLFADVGVIESFIPTWAWDEPKAAKKKLQKAKDSDGEGDE